MAQLTKDYLNRVTDLLSLKGLNNVTLERSDEGIPVADYLQAKESPFMQVMVGGNRGNLPSTGYV